MKQTKQIKLRQVAQKDLNGIQEAYQTKSIPITYSLSSAEALLEDYVSHSNDTLITLSIVDENDTFIGAFDCFATDDTLIVSMYLLPRFQEKGIGTQALTLFVSYIQKNYSFTALEASIPKSNIASNQLVKKCHFQYDSEISNEFYNRWIYSLR